MKEMKENNPEAGKLIAIVEDDPDVARTIEQVLGDFGFRTIWCRNAGELLRRLRQSAPDLCIVDLGLPDMDGLEVMQRVRAQSPCGILILTGRAHVSDRVMGLELGADDYVLKPFEPRELVARVRSILRRREQLADESSQLAEFAGMHEAGIVAVSDDGMPVMDAELMRRAIECGKLFDLPKGVAYDGVECSKVRSAATVSIAPARRSRLAASAQARRAASAASSTFDSPR